MQEDILTKLFEDVYWQFRIKRKWEVIPSNDYSSSEFSPLFIQRQYWGGRSCLAKDNKTEMVRLQRPVHRHCRWKFIFHSLKIHHLSYSSGLSVTLQDQSFVIHSFIVRLIQDIIIWVIFILLVQKFANIGNCLKPNSNTPTPAKRILSFIPGSLLQYTIL